MGCVESIAAAEPLLPPEHTIVIDDGARAWMQCEALRATWVNGEKPFVFARNINIGIAAASLDDPGCDVILMNDDARLVTPGGFSALAKIAASLDPPAIVAPVVSGRVGCAEQLAADPLVDPRRHAAVAAGRAFENPRLRRADKLCFICVFIPRAILERVGYLDERFTAYGWDDDDYCRRAVAAGFGLFAWEGCIVSHLGPGTFASRDNSVNAGIFRAKWG